MAWTVALALATVLAVDRYKAKATGAPATAGRWGA